MSEATCGHCWHDYGPQSGGVSSTEVTRRGTRRCCHCGATVGYDERIELVPPPQHGPYYRDILNYSIGWTASAPTGER